MGWVIDVTRILQKADDLGPLLARIFVVCMCVSGLHAWAGGKRLCDGIVISGLTKNMTKLSG